MFDLKLSITKACNLRCKYCHYITNVDKNVLPASFWNDVLRQYAELELSSLGLSDRGKKVTITGGEATFHPEFWDILKKAKELGFYVSLPTNGTYMNKELVDRFKSEGVDEVIVAIDGSRESHDFLRGSGTYEKALEGAKLISQSGIPLLLTTCLTKYNYKDLPYVAKLAQDLGAKLLIIFHYIELGRGQKELKNAELSREEIAKSLKTIYELQKQHRSVELCTTTVPHYWVALKISHERGDYVPSYYNKAFAGCRAVKDFIYVTSQADVYPCPLIQTPIGNLKRQTLSEVLSSKEAKVWSRRDYFKECSECRYSDICGGCKVRDESLCPYLLDYIKQSFGGR